MCVCMCVCRDGLGKFIVFFSARSYLCSTFYNTSCQSCEMESDEVFDLYLIDRVLLGAYLGCLA